MSAAFFSHTLRVYYEDTDAGGVVYYANYLKYLERARTEVLRTFGLDQTALRVTDDLVFVVRSISAQYRKGAKLDDLLEVRSTIAEVGRASLRFSQSVMRGEERLLDAEVSIACVKHSLMKPAPLPAALAARLKDVT
jgi:acyl-CoA thioester hydrolase